jgi:hypothetical protein
MTMQKFSPGHTRLSTVLDFFDIGNVANNKALIPFLLPYGFTPKMACTMRLFISFASLLMAITLLQLSTGAIGPLDALSGLQSGFLHVYRSV